MEEDFKIEKIPYNRAMTYIIILGILMIFVVCLSIAYSMDKLVDAYNTNCVIYPASCYGYDKEIDRTEQLLEIMDKQFEEGGG